MAGLRPPKVTDKLVPVFTAAELSALERACAGRGFAQRRDAAVNAVFRATGIVTTPVVTFAEQVEEGLTPRCVRIPPLGIVTSRSGPAARGRGPVAVLAHLARGQPYWSRGRKAIFPSG